LGSTVFFFLAPGTVAFLAPRWIHRNPSPLPWLEKLPVQIAGGLLIFAGLCVLVDCFARFAIQGLGTPAPVAPTKTLVVTGMYRHVRNPMYVAVVGLILGQGLIWADERVAGYGALVWTCFHLFVTLYEEPALRRQFDGEYVTFRIHVPRWIPRLSAWTPGGVSH